MEKVKHKLVLILSMTLFFACKEQSNTPIVLYYDFYKHDTLLLKRAIEIKYEQSGKDDFSKVTISSGDSNLVIFYEKVSDSGILRSLDTFDFKLSHSFYTNAEVELSLKRKLPFFLNVLSKNHDSKIYQIDKDDNYNVIFFDEALPWYSYTCSYYLKNKKLFIIFYNCSVEDGEQYKMSSNSYYKLSGIEGLEVDMNDLNRLSDKIISDTSFFAKYYKFPLKVPQPPVE